MDKKFSTEEVHDLLRRYRLGQCNESERKIVDRWYQSFDKGEVENMDLADLGNLDDLKVRMFENINHQIDVATGDQSIADEDGRPVRNLTFFTFHTLRRVAAVLLVGIAVGIFFYNREPDSVQTTSSHVINDENNGKVAETSLATTLYLSDGSVVWLKKGSRLEFPKTFSGNTREVTLTGEAFFDVAKNPEKPFVIHSDNFTTRVLGTTFNIKAYGDEESQEVVVVTGKVVVSVNQPSSDKVKELVLHPNQKAVYSKKNNSLVESAADGREKKIASGKYRLFFDETSLEDIIKVLNATYGVNISASSENMNHCMITADLRNETLEVDMAILSKAINATYTIMGKDIILRGDGCGLQPENNKN